MIYSDDDGRISVQLGTGEVGVLDKLMDNPNATYGVIQFSYQPPEPITSASKVDEEDLNDYEVRLVFTKVESVDKMIAKLNHLKQVMLSA